MNAPPSAGSFNTRGRTSPAGLPETASYNRSSVEQSRQTQRRYHVTNSLYRTPSAGSARRSDHEGVDGGIAHGLAEEADQHGKASAQRTSSRTGPEEPDEGTFLPARDAGRHTGSILPSAAFFSPKRPPQSHSPVPPLTHLPGSLQNGDRHGMGARSSDQLGSDFAQRGEPLPLDVDGKERRIPRYASRGTSLNRSSSFESHARHDGQVHVISASGRGTPSVRAQASQDGLLSAGNQHNQSRRASAASLSKSRPQSRDAGTKSSRNPSQGKMPNALLRKGERGYRLHRGANRFFLSGLIMTSDSNPLPFLASLVIMIALPVLWFIFVAPFTWRRISPAPVIVFAYVFVVALTSMCVTAWRDPGVLPRDMDPDPPCSAGLEGQYIDISDPLAIPLPRIVRLRHGTDLKVKWCDTCGTYRPPRSSHCRVCDNCVENIDHHCTFLNTCIGRRNYFTFFAFLISSILACFLSIAFCVLHIYYLTRSTQTRLPRTGFGEGKTFRQALQATPVSAVLFFLSIGVVIPLLTLFSYHVRLICLNRTTVEQIRINTTRSYSEKPGYDEESIAGAAFPPGPVFRLLARCFPCFDLGVPGRDPNPFAYRSMLRNIRSALLRPITAESWIDRYHHAIIDERRPNPGMTSSRPVKAAETA